MRRATLVAAKLWLAPVAVLLWQLAAVDAHSPYFLPPSAIVAGMYHLWFSGPPGHLWLSRNAIGNMLPSLARLLGGWAAAGLAGIAVGVAIGRIAVVADLVEPMVHFCRAVPPPMLVPVFLAILRTGTPMEVGTIMFGVIWPVLVNAIDGAKYVDRLQMETAQAFRLPAGQRLLRIVLPAAAPKIFAGLRLSLSLALIMMVISEFVGATNGLGLELNLAEQNFDVGGMWDIIVLLGVIGVLLNAAFIVAERRVLAWQRGTGQPA